MNGQRDNKIGLIGAGRVASVLAPALQRSGYTIHALASRSPASASRLSALLTGRAQVCAHAQNVANACDLVFIATPDDAIAQVAAQVQWRKGQAVVHTSGALTTDTLDPVRQAGGLAGAFHPLQTFAAAGHGQLGGVTVAIEADGELGQRLERMAFDLGCRPIWIRPEDRALYHVAGVLASNYVVALVNAAAGLLEGQGLPRRRALEALLPLLRGAIENLDQRGAPGALTGPVARGDLGTIARHLDVLARRAPELSAAYRELGLLALPIAKERGSFDHLTAKRLQDLLSLRDTSTTQEASA
jgi:predicted short-subunit dehydrogenase-like oxidoreductase (DUF2520 family)